MKSLKNISDWDLEWLAKNEFSLMDNEFVKIERSSILTTLYWQGVYRNGSIAVLKDAVCIFSGDKTFYLTQKSVDYLRGRGYEICNDFVYKQDARFVV